MIDLEGLLEPPLCHADLGVASPHRNRSPVEDPFDRSDPGLAEGLIAEHGCVHIPPLPGLDLIPQLLGRGPVPLPKRPDQDLIPGLPFSLSAQVVPPGIIRIFQQVVEGVLSPPPQIERPVSLRVLIFEDLLRQLDGEITVQHRFAALLLQTAVPGQKTGPCLLERLQLLFVPLLSFLTLSFALPLRRILRLCPQVHSFQIGYGFGS